VPVWISVLCASALLALASCGSERAAPAASVSEPVPTADAVELIHGCRVTAIVSLHSGRTQLELVGGRTVTLAGAEVERLYEAARAAAPGCGEVVIATE
jgi:hypothetical protein